MSLTASQLIAIVNNNQSLQDLKNYYAKFTGRMFDLLDGGGDRADLKNVYTCCDLVAVECLSVRVPSNAAIELLNPKGLGGQVSALLEKIPTNIDLGTSAASGHIQHGSKSNPGCSAEELWYLLYSLDKIGPVIAGKLVARKRPQLIPVLDSVTMCAYNFADPDCAWTEIDELLKQQVGSTTLLDTLSAVRAQAAQSTPEIGQVSLLRVLDVILWMRHWGNGKQHQLSGCPGPNLP